MSVYYLEGVGVCVPSACSMDSSSKGNIVQNRQILEDFPLYCLTPSSKQRWIYYPGMHCLQNLKINM